MIFDLFLRNFEKLFQKYKNKLQKAIGALGREEKLGAKVIARIDLRKSLLEIEKAELRLSCFENATHEAGKSSDTSEIS